MPQRIVRQSEEALQWARPTAGARAKQSWSIAFMKSIESSQLLNSARGCGLRRIQIG